MKVPDPIDPNAPLTFNVPHGSTGQLAVLSAQEELAKLGYTILGACVQYQIPEGSPVSSGATRIVVYAAPSEPVAALRKEMLGDIPSGPMEIAGHRIELNIETDLSHSACSYAGWGPDSTLVEPRGILAPVVAQQIKVENRSASAELNYSSLCSADFPTRRSLPRLNRAPGEDLFQVVLRFCRDRQHHLEFLGTNEGREAVAILRPSAETMVDSALRTPIGDWYRKTHMLTLGDMQWKLRFHLSPNMRTIAPAYMPSVLVPPQSRLTDLFNITSKLINEPSVNQGDDLDRLFYLPLESSFLRDSRRHVSDIARAAAQAGVLLLIKQHKILPNPMTWVHDLDGCGEVGRLLVQAIQHRLPTESAGMDQIYEACRDLPTLPQFPFTNEQAFEAALKDPPRLNQEIPNVRPAKLKVPSPDFRL